MKKRLEYKYLISNSLLDSLRNDISGYMIYDPFAMKQPEREYVVRSIYLDTSGYKSYTDKAEGLEKRSKFRIRGYNSKSNEMIVFLEIKKKEASSIIKSRSRIYYHDLNSLFSTNNISKYILGDNMIEKGNASQFLYYYHLHNLVPSYLVIYKREAYQCKFGSDLRITFDKNVRSAPAGSLEELFEEKNMKSSWPGYFIMEIKFNSLLPAWLPKLITKYGFKRVSASKYAMCFEVHSGKNLYNRNINSRILAN